MIKVSQSYIPKLSLHSVNSVLILYRIGNMQSAILLSFVAFSSLPPYRLQSTHPPISCISPYVVYNIYGASSSSPKVLMIITCHSNTVYYKGQFRMPQQNFCWKLAQVRIFLRYFKNWRFNIIRVLLSRWGFSVATFFQKNILRAIKQCKNRLKKEKRPDLQIVKHQSELWPKCGPNVACFEPIKTLKNYYRPLVTI